MRRLTLLFAAAVVLSAATSCKRPPAKVETIEAEQPELASVVSAGDPAHAVQFVQGFYDIEQGAWRWTRGKFSITLQAPGGAAQKGATLELKFVLPGAVIQKTGPVTMSAVLDGNALPPEKFEKEGAQVLRREIPPAIFRGPSVNVEFTLDKFLAAGAVEERELGVIVQTAALMAK